jgi:hypothetical protein
MSHETFSAEASSYLMVSNLLDVWSDRFRRLSDNISVKSKRGTAYMMHERYRERERQGEEE